ncbi:MAG: carboxypeptidase regulatory-like domain-containing protein [Gemmatimonadota bacterium]
MKRRLGRASAVAWLTLGCMVGAGSAPHAIAGQGIEGIVRLASTGVPAPGVLVAAFEEGRRVRSVLTNGTGHFSLELPPGVYSLQAERIGLTTSTVERVVVAPGTNPFETIEMADRAIELEGLVVDSRVRSCRTNARDADRIQRWWSEVRTALGVSSALQEEEFGTFIVERFQRVWDEDDPDDFEEPVGVGRRWSMSTSTRPFVSAPAEELMTGGFVTGRFGMNREYFGPDADVLLSTTFLNAHCFSLEDDDRNRPGQVGLRFDPVEERHIVDIAGTFWVDTTSATLTDLEFEYVDLDGPDADGAGGHATFDYLDSGAWIVSEWFIRIPRTGARGRRNRLTTIGYFDGGGRVTPIPRVGERGDSGTIQGVLRDRLRGGVLAGATVSVLGTDLQTTTDDAGRFRLDAVPPGLRYIGVSHTDLMAWGIDVLPEPVELSRGGAADIELATPDFKTAAFTLCRDAGVEARTGITGRALAPEGRPLMGVRVRLQYEVRHGGGGSLSTASTTTDESGRYAVCSVPPDVDVTLSLPVDGEWRSIIDFPTREERVTVRDFRFDG